MILAQDRDIIEYQARAKLLEFGLDIAKTLNRKKIQPILKRAAKLRYLLKALDVDDYLTSAQVENILQAVISVSEMNEFPAAPTLENRERPAIILGAEAASQTEVNNGSAANKFVSPTTLAGWMNTMGLYTTIRVDFLGAVGDGVTDDWQVIQDAIDTYVGEIIVIPSDYVFLISKPLIVPSNSIIQNDGTVKMANSNIRSLVANASIGQSYLEVTNADQYFEADQWIVISDDNKPLAGGVATTRTADGNYVTSVTPTRVNLRTPLISNFTTAASAQVGQGNSCFILDTVTNIKIFGTGIIDNNRQNGYDRVPVSEFSSGIEALRQQCGISCYGSSDVEISGVTVKNSALHGIAVYNSSRITVRDFNISSTKWKSLLFFNATDCEASSGKIKTSVYEDGVTVYTNNARILVSNIRAEDCRRYAFACVGTPGGNHNTQIQFANISAVSCTTGLFIANASKGAVSVDNFIHSGVNSGSQGASVIFTNAQNISLYNINADGVVGSGVGPSTWSAGSDCSDININGGVISNCTSTAAFNSAGTRIIFDNIKVDSTNGFVFALSSSTTYLRNCIINLAKTLLINSTGTNPCVAKFVNCKGSSTFRSSNAGNATIPSGKTFIIVSHGLTYIPLKSQVQVTPTNSLGSATKFYISDITDTSFKINVDIDPGATTAKFGWVIDDQYENTETAEVTYTQIYSSDFSAGVDGWTTTNSVAAGNIDSIGGLDNNLRFYADATNSVHGVLRASTLQVGSTNRVTIKAYVPASQNKVNGIRLLIGGATTIFLKYNGFGLTLDAWNEFTSEEFTPASSTLTIYGINFGSNSFIGANSVTDDLVYINSILTEYR